MVALYVSPAVRALHYMRTPTVTPITEFEPPRSIHSAKRRANPAVITPRKRSNQPEQLTLEIPSANPTPDPWCPPPRHHLLASRRLIDGILEVLIGIRPQHQLGRLLTEEVNTHVSKLRQQRAPRETRYRLRSLRVSAPANGVLETAATIRLVDRVRALAARIEHEGPRYRCTSFAIL